ncbi:MAG TPA: hypothetical protein VMR21_08195 [Vicinamibacteria bacterium]|nr:hypothetical protein [Vicinamibacteria bacterium]
MLALTRASAVLLLAALPLLARPSGAAGAAHAWTITQDERTLAGGTGVRETRWRTSRPPGGPYDQIVYFGATGMGVEWLLGGIASAGGAGSKDVTIHVLEGYGHVDVIAGDQSRRDVFEPVLAWLQKRSPR